METETTTTANIRLGDYYGVIREINTIHGGYRYVVGCWVDLGRNELILIHIMPPVGEKITFDNPIDARLVAKRFNKEIGPGDATPVYEWERVSHMLHM